MINNRPILVTGAHRTGTTWVGKMLALSNQTAYISEPLNVLHRPGVLITPTRYWYTYITTDNEAEYLPGLQQTLGFRYHALAELLSLRSLKDAGRMGRDWSIFLRGRLLTSRPLLKDPFAVFSTPWFRDRLGCQVVITIRHPAAFVSSLKRLNWPFNLNDLLDQPLLMRDWLDRLDLREEMEQIAKDPNDVVGQNSLLWKMVYQAVAEMRADSENLPIVRHEDLSLRPVEGFRALYDNLGLDFTPEIEEKILASSSSENPKELSRRSVHSVRLDSQANLNNWKNRLTSAEISRIRQITEETAALYYPNLSMDTEHSWD